jgi:hypothetical protein
MKSERLFRVIQGPSVGIGTLSETNDRRIYSMGTFHAIKGYCQFCVHVHVLPSDEH